MTTEQKIQMINEAVAGPRGSYARDMKVSAAVVNGKVLYTGIRRGKLVRLSFFEVLSYLHGEDARAIRSAAA